MTDGSEAEFEHFEKSPNSRGELASGSKGFRLGYVQRECKKEECFSCKRIETVTYSNSEDLSELINTTLSRLIRKRNFIFM